MEEDPEEEYVKNFLAKEFKVKGWCKICGSSLMRNDPKTRHQCCKMILQGKTDHKSLPVRWHIGYYKQGDDLNYNVIEYPEGVVDIYSSFSRFKNQLEGVVDQIQSFIDEFSAVKEIFPDFENHLFIQSDTHSIDFRGPTKPILKLIQAGVVRLDYGMLHADSQLVCEFYNEDEFR